MSEAKKETLSCDWLAHHQTGWQYGEQGVIEAIIKQIEADIPPEHRWCVEFGAGDGATLPLMCEPIITREGWKSLLIECDRKKADVLRLRVPPSATIVNDWVTINPGSTIDEHMDRHGCPQTPALMVIDVNSIDYYIAANMKANPYILCVEHMDEACESYTGAAFVPRIEDCGKQMGNGYELQANSAALDATMLPAGYSLIYRTRVNSLYARNDIAAKIGRRPDGKIRLNLGAGDYNDPRYTPLDIKTGTDIRHLPYADGTVAEVYMSHLLEHFSFYERDEVLKECMRVLEPGGLLRIAVPDQKKMAEEWLKSDESGRFADLEMVQYGAHSDPNDVHHAGYTETQLRRTMHRAGCGGIVKFHPFIKDDCANHPLSLNLEGRKRWWPKIEKPKIVLVLSQPRIVFAGHEKSLIELAKKLDFEIQMSNGAFWDRDMTVATQVAIDRFDPDFLIYSDYDSVFEVDDVKKLIEAINNDPEMAAIGSVQMSRHDDEPLVLDDTVDYDGVVVRVNYQHFGLTVIRREVFDELPQPWFWSIPGRNDKGDWDWIKWARSDADITFWRNLSLMGFRVCQHNGVCIGHICQCIKYPRNKGRGVQYIPIENYWKTGKPRDATFNPELYAKSREESPPITRPSEPQPEPPVETPDEFPTMDVGANLIAGSAANRILRSKQHAQQNGD